MLMRYSSSDGKLLAYGSSDLAIGILDAATLNVSATVDSFHLSMAFLVLLTYLAVAIWWRPMLRAARIDEPANGIPFSPYSRSYMLILSRQQHSNSILRDHFSYLQVRITLFG